MKFKIFLFLLTIFLSFNVSGELFSFGYIGCFKDRGDPNGIMGRDLNGFMSVDRLMTVEKCIKTCKSRGFLYAGVQYSTYCFCGDSYGKYGRTDNCDMRCSGNHSEICGGFWANSVYKVKEGVKGEIDLTGIWSCDDGGMYYITQMGKDVWWYGERLLKSPKWSNVAHGLMRGDIISLKWCYIPKGRLQGRGSLVLKIVSPIELKAIKKNGYFKGNKWVKER